MIIASFTVVKAEVRFKNDRPSLILKLGDPATVQCCCDAVGQTGVNVTWFTRSHEGRQELKMLNHTEDISVHGLLSSALCGNISFKSVTMNDTGLYYCSFSQGGRTISSHGTYLHVYSKCLCVCYDVR